MTTKREIQLTEYEFQRVQELTAVLNEAEVKLQQTTLILRQLVDSMREVQGRKAELLELLGNKYEFDPKAQLSLDKENKIILEG